MNKLNNYKFLSILLIIAATLLFYVPQAQAKGVITAIVAVIAVVLIVVAVVVIAIAAGAIVAQAGLALAPTVFTTLAGTVIVGAVMVGAALLAADCLFDGAAGGAVDPNIICKPRSEGGVSGGALQVDVRANGSDGPISLLAPADFRIQWAISGADQSTACTATDAWSGDITNATGESQMSSVSSGNYSYGIRCNRSSDGASTYDSVTVNVIGPPTIDFRTSDEVELPNPINLAWATENADSLTASGDWSGPKQAGPLPYKTEQLFKPRGSYIFTLTATGPAGTASETRNVRVIQVPRCSFIANPTSIIPPASSTLSWSCQYADSCSIDQGIGSVNNVSGTKGVRPIQTTDYTLTCGGLDDSRSYYATVNVGFTPKLREVIPR